MGKHTPNAPIVSLGVPDARWKYDRLDLTNSSYTVHLPRPVGQAVPTSAYAELGLEVSGYQADDWDFVASHAGMPGVDGARVKYRADGAADSTLRGWQAPNYWGDWVAAEYTAAATSTWSIPDAVVIPSTQEVVAIYGRTDSVYSTYVRVFDPATRTWSAQHTVESGGSATQAPAICVIPGSERLLAWVWDSRQLYASDDAGATWSLWAHSSVRSSYTMTGTPKRARLFYTGGDLGLVAISDTAGTISLYQYASDSLGTDFTRVKTWTSPGGVPDVIVLKSGKLLCVRIDASNNPQARVVGGVWEDLSAASDIEVDSSITVSEVALVQDYDGSVYLYGRGTSTNAGAVYVWRCDDDGATWTRFDYSAYQTTDTGSYPTSMTAVPFLGHVGLVHQWAANPGDEDLSVGMAILGGWSTWQMAYPDQASSDDDLDLGRMSWGLTTIGGSFYSWAPYDLPSNVGDYTMGGNTGTETLTGGRLQVVTAAQQQWWYITTSTDTRGGWAGLIRADAGGSNGQTDIGIQIELANNTWVYTLCVNLTTTSIEAYDAQLGAQKAIASGLTASQWWQIAAFVVDGVGVVMYAAPGSSTWTVLWEGALTDGGGGTATGRIRAGGGIDGNCNATSSWRCWGLGRCTYGDVWESDAASTAAHDDAIGKGLTDEPYPMGDLAVYDWDEDSSDESFATWLRATDGPAGVGDVYEAPAASDYPLTAVFVELSPSPDEEWQSVDDASDVTIALDIPQAALDTWLGSSSVVVALLAANFRTAYLKAEDAAGGGVVTLATIDLATGYTGLSFERDGDRVSPTTGTADAGRVTRRHEHVGATLKLDDGGGTVVYRRVLSHTEGWWTDNTTRISRYVLEDVAGGDPTTGTCQVWAHSGVHVQHGLHTADLYRRWELVIPAQDTADGRFRLGGILVMALQPIGKGQAKGMGRSGKPNVADHVDEYGTPHPERLGPRVRTLTLNWQHGSLRGRFEDDSSADYLAPSTDPLVLRDDVYPLLDGILRDLDGGAMHTVLLVDTPTTSVTLTDPLLWAYGVLTGSVSSTHVAGYEGDTTRKVFERGNAISFRETPYDGPR